jgi:RNA polymerase II subunit A-like phosphatase
MKHVERLLTQRKLSLLLDLDQTVVHATVDETVGQWLEDPENPSFPTMTEVHSFTLPDSPIKYFIKLRPGTLQFLEQLQDKYEMHIYTMGTRNYANAVANVIDPTKKYFQDRILSRDDSGSMTTS